MNLAKSTIKVFGASVLTSLSSFLAVILFSHELGASPLGTYYPFIALLSIIAIPANFGVRGALEKRLSEGEDQSSYLGSALLIKSAPLMIVAVILLLTKDYVNAYLGADLGILLVLSLPLFEASKMGLYVLRGELRVGETAVVKVLRPLGWLVFGYYFLRGGYGVYAPIYGYLIGTALMIVVGWWKVSTPVGRPTVKHTKSLLEYSRYSVVSHVGGYFYSWMDVAILSAFVATGIAATRAGIGAYENAWRLSLVATMASRAIAVTLFPQISRWDAEEATTRIESVISSALLPSVLLVIPAFAGTLVLSDNLLRILFGSEFTVASTALVILMGEKVLQSFHVVFSKSLQAIDRPDLAAYATVVAVVLNLVLNIILIWQYGIVGAALATGLSFAVNTALHAYYLRQFITLNFPVRETAWSAIAASVMCLSVFLVESAYNISSEFDLFAVVISGAVVYGCIMLISGSIRDVVRHHFHSYFPVYGA